MARVAYRVPLSKLQHPGPHDPRPWVVAAHPLPLPARNAGGGDNAEPPTCGISRERGHTRQTDEIRIHIRLAALDIAGSHSGGRGYAVAYRLEAERHRVLPLGDTSELEWSHIRSGFRYQTPMQSNEAFYTTHHVYSIYIPFDAS